MATELTVIQADINDKLPGLSFVQYDNLSRVIRFEMTDRTSVYKRETGEYINLTGCSVYLIASKPSKLIVMQSGELLDAENGQFQFALEQQVLTEVGSVDCQILIMGEGNRRLSSQKFKITVMQALAEDPEITSSTELSALTEALSGVLSAAETVEALEAIHIGTVETLPPGGSATATFNKETGELNFAIPQGSAGAAGAPGQNGANGKDGADGTSITVVQLANRAAYDALSSKDANTLYVWGQ